jgi:hypothetical protein
MMRHKMVFDIINESICNVYDVHFISDRHIILPDEAWQWRVHSIKLVDNTWILLNHTGHPSTYQAKMNAAQVKFRMEYIATQVKNKIKGFADFGYLYQEGLDPFSK